MDTFYFSYIVEHVKHPMEFNMADGGTHPALKDIWADTSVVGNPHNNGSLFMGYITLYARCASLKFVLWWAFV